MAHPGFYIGGINLTKYIYLPGWELVALVVLSLLGTMHGISFFGGVDPFVPLGLGHTPLVDVS